jgi:hypothetical protein
MVQGSWFKVQGKKLVVVIAISLIWLLLPQAAQAANHYIRDGASGDGSDWNNARDDLPASLVRGDTYYIADGNYNGGYTFNDPCSGSLYIYIKKAIASDHGTDTGWQSSYGDGQAVFIQTTVSTDRLRFAPDGYWIFDGQVGGGPGNWDGSVTPYGFKILLTATGSSDHLGMIVLGNQGTNPTDKPHHSRFRHIEFSLPNWEANASTVIPIYFKDGSADDYPDMLTDIEISYCYFSRYQEGGLEGDNASNMLVEYCFFDKGFKNGGNKCSIWHDQSSDNVTFRYNICKDGGGTGMLDLKNQQNNSKRYNWYVYGNIFMHTNAYIAGGGQHVSDGVIADNGDAGDTVISGFYVYNNDFINIITWEELVALQYADIIENCYCYNNIFYSTQADAGAGPSASFKNFTLGWNWFYDNKHINTNIDADLAAGCPNSQIGTENPFVDWEGGTLNFNLIAATDAGTTLPGYDKDMFGVTRGADGVWDRGAIEYISGASVLYGDVSGDGEISAYDAALTAQAAVGLITLTAEQFTAADVDGSKDISAYDAALIAQRAVGLIEKFPVEE